MKDVLGRWYPDQFRKQLEVFNCFHRALLVSGPRLSGKTRAVLHKICRHLFETKGARVAMFSRVMKNAKDAGTWKILINNIIPKWVEAGIGFEFTTKDYDDVPGPKVDGQTRTPYFRIRNMYGGESELMLFSLDDDNEIESKLKEREFSMIYFSELSNFNDRKVLSIALLSLRMEGLRYDQHQWIADTNPGEEGEQSWIYQVFYRERTQPYDEYRSEKLEFGWSEEEILTEAEFLEFQKNIQLIEILPEENEYLDPKQLAELKRTYSYDPGLFARYVQGKWVYGDGDKSRHFRSHFKPALHVRGHCEGQDESKWEVILPSDSITDIITGWDLGETNHAAVAMEKQLKDVYNPANKTTVARGFFSVLDEQVTLKQEITIDEFTETFMELIVALEDHIGRPVSLEHAWSDRSSIEKFSAAAGTFPYLQVHAASGYRIYLEGVAKGAGSVRIRVQLLKLLLAQNRIKVSAHCHATIRMLKDLKKGKDKVNYVVSDENKHVFDALTYALIKECEDELLTIRTAEAGQRRPLALAIK